METQTSLLRYSGETMSSYIKSYRLLNFQSWDDSSPDINLETDMVNIIEGANETGKSVLYKVLYNFCFPGYWTPTELIRRGCDVGVMLLELQDGAAIIYILKPNEYTYVLVESDDTKKVWTNQGCPDEIIQRLGLILDNETQVILNVIDSDIALPFIKTTPKFNASLIRAIVEPESMTRFFENLQNTSQRVENAKFFFSEKSKALDIEVQRLPYIDVDAITDEKRIIDYYLHLAESINKLEGAVVAYQLVQNSCPSVVQNPDVYKPLIDAVSAIQKLNKGLSHLQDVKQVIVPEVCSVENIKQDISRLEHIESLMTSMTNLHKLVNSVPREVILPDVENVLKVINLLTETINKLKHITELKASLAACPECPDVYDKIQALDLLNRCKISAINCVSCIAALDKQNETIQSLAAEINSIARDAGVCPTCGQLLRGVQ